ncbi:LapA family protein [Carnobacterium divergens]|uniref:LapA family protein n=1 Tax=Carnobacterium divergens TaxID=2748 RepID=UPI00128E2084|nr:LapA family protein [Carnobacterium divergens]MPQ21998.1 LapA family protein [Carnobacterium divergens]
MEKLKEFFTIKRTLILIGIILILIFAFSNLEPVSVNFLVAEVKIPLFYEIVGIGVIGFICGYFLKNKK